MLLRNSGQESSINENLLGKIDLIDSDKEQFTNYKLQWNFLELNPVQGKILMHLRDKNGSKFSNIL